MKIAGVYGERLDRIIRLDKPMTIIELAVENEELRNYRDQHILYVDNYSKILEDYENKITELKAELIHANEVNKNGKS
jgi:hypothetical protein